METVHGDKIDPKGVDVTTFQVGPSPVIVMGIAKSAGLEGVELEKAVEVAQGNPGAMHKLIEVREFFKNSPTDFEIVLTCLKIKNFTGSIFYSFVKQHGADSAASQLYRMYCR